MINTELHNGDCLEYMKKIPTSSIDLIITDASKREQLYKSI